MPCFGRGRHFVPVSTVEVVEDLAMSTFPLDPRGQFRASLWILGAVVLLTISSIIYMVAFLTTGWGTVTITTLQGQDDQWIFGLWQCCRQSDSLCIGPRWPESCVRTISSVKPPHVIEYYSVTRAFGVLGLFGQILTLAWLIGFALEKILDYDPCTLIALVSLDFFTTIVITIQVAVFGTMWEHDMETMFADVTQRIDAELQYSFWMTLSTAFLVVLAGILLIVELRTSIIRLEMQHHAGEYVKEEGSDVLNLSRENKGRRVQVEQIPMSDVNV